MTSPLDLCWSSRKSHHQRKARPSTEIFSPSRHLAFDEDGLVSPSAFFKAREREVMALKLETSSHSSNELVSSPYSRYHLSNTPYTTTTFTTQPLSSSFNIETTTSSVPGTSFSIQPTRLTLTNTLRRQSTSAQHDNTNSSYTTTTTNINTNASLKNAVINESEKKEASNPQQNEEEEKEEEEEETANDSIWDAIIQSSPSSILHPSRPLSQSPSPSPTSSSSFISPSPSPKLAASSPSSPPSNVSHSPILNTTNQTLNLKHRDEEVPILYSPLPKKPSLFAAKRKKKTILIPKFQDYIKKLHSNPSSSIPPPSSSSSSIPFSSILSPTPLGSNLDSNLSIDESSDSESIQELTKLEDLNETKNDHDNNIEKNSIERKTNENDSDMNTIALPAFEETNHQETEPIYTNESMQRSPHFYPTLPSNSSSLLEIDTNDEKKPMLTSLRRKSSSSSSSISNTRPPPSTPTNQSSSSSSSQSSPFSESKKNSMSIQQRLSWTTISPPKHLSPGVKHVSESMNTTATKNPMTSSSSPSNSTTFLSTLPFPSTTLTSSDPMLTSFTKSNSSVSSFSSSSKNNSTEPIAAPMLPLNSESKTSKDSLATVDTISDKFSTPLSLSPSLSSLSSSSSSLFDMNSTLSYLKRPTHPPKLTPFERSRYQPSSQFQTISRPSLFANPKFKKVVISPIRDAYDDADENEENQPHQEEEQVLMELKSNTSTSHFTSNSHESDSESETEEEEGNDQKAKNKRERLRPSKKKLKLSHPSSSSSSDSSSPVITSTSKSLTINKVNSGTIAQRRSSSKLSRDQTDLKKLETTTSSPATTTVLDGTKANDTIISIDSNEHPKSTSQHRTDSVNTPPLPPQTLSKSSTNLTSRTSSSRRSRSLASPTPLPDLPPDPLDEDMYYDNSTDTPSPLTKPTRLSFGPSNTFSSTSSSSSSSTGSSNVRDKAKRTGKLKNVKEMKNPHSSASTSPMLSPFEPITPSPIQKTTTSSLSLSDTNPTSTSKNTKKKSTLTSEVLEPLHSPNIMTSSHGFPVEASSLDSPSLYPPDSMHFNNDVYDLEDETEEAAYEAISKLSFSKKDTNTTQHNRLTSIQASPSPLSPSSSSFSPAVRKSLKKPSKTTSSPAPSESNPRTEKKGLGKRKRRTRLGLPTRSTTRSRPLSGASSDTIKTSSSKSSHSVSTSFGTPLRSLSTSSSHSSLNSSVPPGTPIRIREPVPKETSIGPSGRPQRLRIKPLDWWRGECLEYGRQILSNGVVTTGIKHVVRVPELPSTTPKRVRTNAKKQGRAMKPKGVQVTLTPLSADKASSASSLLLTPHLTTSSLNNDENGIHPDTLIETVPPINPQLPVVDYVTQRQVVSRVAHFPSLFEPTVAKQGGYMYHRVYEDRGYFNAGIIVLEPGQEKPKRTSGDNDFMYTVLQGVVDVSLHVTEFKVGPGCFFVVPRGNVYRIHNSGPVSATLHFTSARLKDATTPKKS